MKRGPARKQALPAHYGDLRMQATMWWSLQRARIRLTQAVVAAKKAGWSTAGDPLSVGLAALAKQERIAARSAVAASAIVYPIIARLVEETAGLGAAVALFLGLVPPLRRLEDFPGFPCPAALWAYCGLSAKRRAKCDRRARMLAIAYVATPAIINQPQFRALYQARRLATVDRGWQKMHAHRDATRYVAKRILKYLWLCRLPSGHPHDSLAPLDQIAAAGTSSSVPLPPDTLALLENPHGDELSAAPELDVLPIVRLPSETSLSALESEALPMNGFVSTSELSAPEPGALPPVALLSDQLFPTQDAE